MSDGAPTRCCADGEALVGNTDGEHELRRGTAMNSGELHCESEGGARRESELEQGEGEGSAGTL